MTKSYLITLTPTGKFFFGGEMTFSVKGEDKEYNEQYSSYIITSNKMPQQTSLLGMLRFLILRNAEEDVFCNNTIVSSEIAAELIGKSSFRVNSDNHAKNDYGKIGSITPCFLLEGQEPVDVFCKVNPDLFDMQNENSTTAMINGKNVCVPKNSYNPKEEAKKSDPLGKYFREDQRIGLNKDNDGNTKDGNTKDKDDDTDLFKQVNYRLNEEKSLKFAFYANVDSEIPLADYDGQLVSLGADGSTFVIGITEAAFQNAKTDRQPNGCAVILTSPAYIGAKELSDVVFATTSVIPFRFLSTTVHTKSYHRLGGEIRQGVKYNLYDTGSVFYFNNQDSMNKFADILCGYEDFRQIGYNYFKKEIQN